MAATCLFRGGPEQVELFRIWSSYEFMRDVLRGPSQGYRS